MYLGVYNACLGDKPLGEALDIIAGIGMTSVEINSGGFLPPIHLPVEELRASEDARQEYLGEFSSRGLTLTALNCNGNPLFPREASRTPRTSSDSIELAALLGVKRVITMSGAPAGSPSGTNMGGTRCRWSPLLDVRDHQWERGRALLEGDPGAGRRGRRQGRPSRCTRATSSSTRRRCTASPRRSARPTSVPRWTRATCSGRASTRCSPSRTSASSWSSPPPRTPGSTRPPRSTACSTTGSPASPRASPATCPSAAARPVSGWPSNPSWDFVAVGRGHDVAWWTEFLRALRDVDPDMPVNIEHEDQELDQLEGLTFAANTLLEAEKAL